MQQQEPAQHRARHRDPRVLPLALVAPPAQGDGQRERGQHRERREPVDRGVKGRAVGERADAPVPDRVRGDVRPALLLERDRRPPALVAQHRERQVRQHRGDHRGGAHLQRAGHVVAPLPSGEHEGGQWQHEHRRVQLEREPEPEQHRRDHAALCCRPLRPSRPAISTVHDPHRTHRARHHRQVPVVEGVEHQRWAERPQQCPPPGQPREHPRSGQAERRHEERRDQQEVGVGVGAERADPDQYPAQHGVLDGSAVELAALGDPAGQVGHVVVAEIAGHPQVLDVGVADVPADPDVVAGKAAALVGELRAGAAGLVGVAEEQRQPAQHHHDQCRRAGPPARGHQPSCSRSTAAAVIRSSSRTRAPMRMRSA